MNIQTLLNKISNSVRNSDSNSTDNKKNNKLGFSFRISSMPEKLFIGAGAAAALALIFDDSHKRRKHPEKARGFFRRFIDNYARIDGILMKTAASDLKKYNPANEGITDETLKNMEIEEAYIFDVKEL